MTVTYLTGGVHPIAPPPQYGFQSSYNDITKALNSSGPKQKLNGFPIWPKSRSHRDLLVGLSRLAGNAPAMV